MGKLFHWRGLEFDMSNSNVYPPNPASLLLAKTAISKVKHGENVLDTCTGCGIVAIAIAKFVKNSHVKACDINPEAIKVTNINASINKVNVKALLGDLFEPFDRELFDTVTAHPPATPYPKKENFKLHKDMNLATNGGRDGTYILKRTVIEARRCLKKNGRILLLLPHWSNTKKILQLIEKNYVDVSIVAKKKIKFWQADSFDKEIVEYTYELAKSGLIEIKFEKGQPFSTVSVVQAFHD